MGSKKSRFLRELTDKINQNHAAKWAFRSLLFLVFIALFANILANSKPYFCVYEGEWHAPAFKAIGVDIGLYQWKVGEEAKKWSDLELESTLWPPVRYNSKKKDLSNRLASPFGQQKTKSIWFRHWLGTDQLGRDVLAVIIWGTRTAIIIGFGAAFIAGLIGVFLGAIAGFFGDVGFQLSRSHLLGLAIGTICGIFLGFVSRQHLWYSQERILFLIGGIAILAAFSLGLGLLFGNLRLGAWAEKKVNLPIDILVMRSIETLNALPALLLLLAIVAIIPKPTILSIILIIGFLTWTNIARFTRSELLRIRSLEYIEAGKTLGFQSWRILWKHALPNAMAPVLVTLTFATAGAILTEASLSFLGIGMPSDVITWGHLLSDARQSPAAWWLAIFPGLALSATILTLFAIGESLSIRKS